MSEWFGKGCKYLAAQWETCDVEADTENTGCYKESEPVLVFCNHKENLDQSEGNCNKKDCPLLKKILQNQKDIPKEFVDVVNKNFWDLI